MGGRPYLAVLPILMMIVVPSAAGIAYGHGIQSGPVGRPIRIDNEQFSDNTVTTDDVVIITGEIRSVVDRPVKLVPHIYVDHDAVPPYTNVLATIYPPLKNQSIWYFRVEHNLPNPTVLGPRET